MKICSGKIVFLSVLAFLIACASSGFRAPRVINKGNPDYPLSAQLEQAEGEVVLALFVNSDGYVEEVSSLNTSGRGDLDSAAFKFAENLQFEPASLDGNPLSVWTKLVLRFQLSEIHFDPNRWLLEVESLKNKIHKETDPTERNRLQKKLYARYHGLLNHIAKNPDREINLLIEKVITPKIWERWRNFWYKWPVGFAVLDDFVERYPDDVLTHVVKGRLVEELLDARYRLKTKFDSSTSFAKKNAGLLQTLDARLLSLGVILPAER